MANATSNLADSLAEQIRNSIIGAMQERYVSTSSHMDYKTGNAYQTVELDDLRIPGYRSDRSELFNAFNLRGLRIVDCGSNLGELSRLARRCGASLVDGIEFDDYFVRIAQLINAYRGTSRVSFTQGDLTKADTFSDIYDVALTFSVFPYIVGNLERLHAVVRQAIILETHDVSASLADTYVKPLSRYFLYHSFVGFTDFGHGQGKRAVILFAKDAGALAPGGLLNSTLDLNQAEFSFVNPMLTAAERIAPSGARTLADIRRVVSEIGDVPYDMHELTGGLTYWLRMMKGFLHARDTGILSMNNPYVQTLRSALRLQGFDATLTTELASEDLMLDRVRRRFEDIERTGRGEPLIDPVTVKVDLTDELGRYRVRNGVTGVSLAAREIDGYHRVFWAKFFNVPTIPAVYALM